METGENRDDYLPVLGSSKKSELFSSAFKWSM